MKTRFEKLELLRKALIIATKELFPEIPESCIIDVELTLHQCSQELMNLARENNFRENFSGNTRWASYPVDSTDGDITFFEAR